ncbi:MAG TPA: hypothetical protein VF116_20475 [Ktedonobacterales bacterium]
MRSERVVADTPRGAGGDKGEQTAKGAPSGGSGWAGRAAAARAWAGTATGGAWLDAAWVWLVTRAIFVALTVLVPAMLTRGGGPSPLSRWGTQDGTLYAQIALHGYGSPVAPMLWPLLPALERLLLPLTGGDPVPAGMLVANAAFFGTLVLLRRLAEREVGPEAARRATWYLAIFPTAFYFFAPYSESLFLLLSIGAFGATRARRWWLAGALGCLAMLARSAGALLVVPFAVEFVAAWRAHAARWWQALWVLLIPAAAGIFSGYLALEHDDPLGWLHAAGLLGHTLHWPWDPFVFGIGELAHLSGVHTITAAHLVLNLLAAAVFVVLTVVALRMLPLSYGLYSAAIVVFFLSLSEGMALFLAAGDGRYVLMIFPAFMVLGVWGRQRRLHELLMVAMPVLMAILAAHFLLLLAGG